MKPSFKTPKKPMFFYYAIVIVAMLLINTFLMPALLPNRIKEVPYSTFVTMLADRQVKEAGLKDTSITFISADEEDKSIYVTGRIYTDDSLVERMLDADVEFTQEIPQQMSPILEFFISWVFPIAVFFVLGQLMTKQMSKRMGGGAMSFGKSNAKVYVQAQTGKSFLDVAGQEEAKEALDEIVDFLHNPAKYKEIGAVLPKGVLLVGPPGTGKTLLAKAVAGEAKVPFFSISGSEFVEMFVGMGAARVRDLFKQAAEKAPCIVFIDEIDAIGKKRDSAGIGGNDEREQTLNQLLAEMDGFDGGKGVVILAATNRPETLDKALLRPGRFDRRVPVELPDLNGREAILKVHAKAVKCDENIDLRAVALATSGASGAELANIVNEAALLAVKDSRRAVTQTDFEEAVENVIAGHQRKGAVISPKEKQFVAYHEIGHAMAAALQSESAPVHKVTIIPRTSGALGYTMQVEEDEKFLMTREEILNKITTLTAGRAAEEIVFGTATSGASNDIEQATRLARTMITRLGMSETFGMTALEVVNNPYLGSDASLMCSNETAAKVDANVMSIIAERKEAAAVLLQSHIEKLHALSKYLLEKETITGEDFMNMLNT